MGDWKAFPQPAVLISSCVMINMKKCPSCLLPLNRSSTKTKTRGRKQNVHGWTPGPGSEECVSCWWASPVSPQDAVHFGRTAGGRLRQTERKDQPQRSAHTHTLSHMLFFSLYIQPQWTAAPWYRLASLLLHSGHCHRQTVQKGTYSWDHRQGRELALQCSVQSAGCCHSW